MLKIRCSTTWTQYYSLKHILCAEKVIEDNINSHFELIDLKRDSECTSVSGVLAILALGTLAVF